MKSAPVARPTVRVFPGRMRNVCSAPSSLHAVVDDARVYHGVTPVTPLDPALSAHRDVLVVTLRAERES